MSDWALRALAIWMGFVLLGISQVIPIDSVLETLTRTLAMTAGVMFVANGVCGETEKP